MAEPVQVVSQREAGPTQIHVAVPVDEGQLQSAQIVQEASAAVASVPQIYTEVVSTRGADSAARVEVAGDGE